MCNIYTHCKITLYAFKNHLLKKRVKKSFVAPSKLHS